MPATSRRSTQPALWPLCPPALHIADPRPANRNFQCFHPREGEAPAEPQTQPTAERPAVHPSASPYCQPTTKPCPRLIAIWNHPAKQLRRSPSTGSGSSPAIRGLSGIWVYGFPTANGFSSGSHGVKKRRLCDINSDVDPLAVSVACQRGVLKCGVPEIRASHPL